MSVNSSKPCTSTYTTETPMGSFVVHNNLTAVEQNRIAFEYVKNQTPEICLAAVKQNGYNLEFVKNQTEEICLAAVKQNGYAIDFVKNQTSKICKTAVKHPRFNIGYVMKQTPQICLAAVEQDGTAISLVEKQTLEICLAAVKQNGQAFQHIKNKTPEICLVAAIFFLKEGRDEAFMKYFSSYYKNNLFSYIREANTDFRTELFAYVYHPDRMANITREYKCSSWEWMNSHHGDMGPNTWS